MTTSYELARIPIDAAKGTAELFFWPLHFGNTIATNTVDALFKVVGTNNEDVPKLENNDEGGRNIYDMASSNLDIAGMIYYYTELRSEIKRLLKNFALEKGMTVDGDDPSQPSDVVLLWNAILHVTKTLESIQSPESSASVKALKDYQTSIEQLDGLRKKLKLDKGDIDVFKTYFEILSVPKNLTSVKSDLIRYDNMIDPQFRFAFGGTEFNRRKITHMIAQNKGIYIHKIDDDFTSTSLDLPGVIVGLKAEIVWAIVVCEVERKITVVFRGSANMADWMKNVNVNMTDFVLPGFTSKTNKNEGQTFGRVHEGFYEYLFGETKKGANGSTKSKGEEIIGMLKGDFFDKPEYKEYTLEVTGHSLGGSLSTMFAFRAAAFGEFPNVVTNVSFASPFVGNQDFRQVFCDLERKRKIRHLRITNYQDVVPLIPATTLPLPRLEQYKHVGMNIRLYDGNDFLAPSYRRFYPKVGSFVDEVRNSMHTSILLGLSVGVLGNHLCPEYDKRLIHEKTAADLQKLTLDELYANKDITGWEYL